MPDSAGQGMLGRVSSDPMAVPTLVIVGLLAIPIVCVLFFGWVAGRKLTHERLLFRCAHCAAEFRQRSHAAFPAACPHCQTRDWSTHSG